MNNPKLSPTVASAPHLRRAGLALVVASLFVIGMATLRPEDGNPIPSLCIICGIYGGVDAILNVLLFMPLGAGLALCSLRGKRALPTMALVSLAIEVTQLVAIPGRDASLGDLMNNTIGGALGFALTRHALVWLRPSPSTARRLTIGWSGFWLLVQAGSSFGLAPALVQSRYYGQIGRSLEVFARFEGKVISAAIGAEAIPDWELPKSASVKSALERGEPVTATVVPGEPTPDLAPIIRVADDKQREILLLAQDRRALVFGVRSGAAVLRLREPLVAMRNVFPDSSVRSPRSSIDTLRLNARHTGKTVELRVSGAATTSGLAVRVRPSLGWTLVAPTEWYLDGRLVEAMVTWFWCCILVTPIGYWSTQASVPGSKGHRNRFLAVWTFGVVLVAIIGLLIIPVWFGIAPATSGDCLAVVAGLLVGSACGRFAVRRALHAP